MIKIFLADEMDYTPFKNIVLLEKRGIYITDNAEECQVFVSRYLNELKPFILQYQSSKSYLIWTHEPRFDTNFEPIIFCENVPVYIMNVYTNNIDVKNFYFYGYFYLRMSRIKERFTNKLPYINEQNFSKAKGKKIATLITYRNNFTLIRDDKNIDLCWLRQKIAIRGKELGKVDIYGKYWPNQLSIENSRHEQWRNRKLDILSQYHFNLCFENTIADYYCTEKILDSIVFGCLPIYYGGENSTIYEDFAKNSFLDYTNFNQPEELFDYVEGMTIEEFNQRFNLCIDAINNIVKKLKNNPPLLPIFDHIAEKLNLIISEKKVMSENNMKKIQPPTNIALNKPTTQSSIFGQEKYGYNPHGSCNGKKTGKFGFHTLKENKPWWQIDLQSNQKIAQIIIYNRMDCGIERASTLDIFLSNDLMYWELCYSNDRENIFGGIDGQPLIVNLKDKSARFVRLQLRENEHFHLDEVEIYSIPIQDNMTQGNNISGYNFRKKEIVTQADIMNMLKKLCTHDTDIEKMRIGNLGDGGYVIPDDLVDIKGVISIGIGQEVSFDLHFAKQGVKVFQYDHTITSLPITHNNFLFSQLGWGAKNEDNLITLAKMLENTGLDNGDLILKFDVENAEWDALSDISPELLKRFRIITCELHGFDKLENSAVFHKVNKVINLLTANHTVVHLHPNNCCGIVFVAGIALPRLIECSFLRNDRTSFYPSSQSIPSSLDYPNVKNKPEIILTPFYPDINLNINSIQGKSKTQNQ
jgi:hypothetical protein